MCNFHILFFFSKSGVAMSTSAYTPALWFDCLLFDCHCFVWPDNFSPHYTHWLISYVIPYVASLCAGGSAYRDAHFGTGSGPIFLDDVQCSSSSKKLLECFSRPILSHNCLHSDDAGVGCEGSNVDSLFLGCYSYLSDIYYHSSL